MSDELKPCPFCGADAANLHGYYGLGNSMAYVYCRVCKVSTDFFNGDDEAVEAWNRRSERTCKIIHRNDFDNALGEHSIWYECGFGILVANGTPEPVYCPGCGAKVVEE